jgi:hypothetical protein
MPSPSHSQLPYIACPLRLRLNCSYFDARCDQLELRFRHALSCLVVAHCECKTRKTNSRKANSIVSRCRCNRPREAASAWQPQVRRNAQIAPPTMAVGTSTARPYTQLVPLQEQFAEGLLEGGPYPCPSKWPRVRQGPSRRFPTPSAPARSPGAPWFSQDQAAPGTARPRAQGNEWAVNHNQTTADNVLEHRLR